MRRVLFVMAWFAAIPACGTDTYGLGGDLDLGDATIDELDSASATGDTKPLFGDDAGDDVGEVDASSHDDDGSLGVDTGTDDTGADMGADTAVDDTGVGDTGVDTGSDTAAGDAEVDGGGADATGDADATPTDAAPDGASDASDDATSDASSDTGGDTGGSGLSSTPGKVSCSKDGAAKQCSGSGSVCRGCYGLDFKWHWDCGGTCLGARDFGCDEKADCDDGKLCCAKNPWLGPDIEGSECRSSCGDDAQLCMTNAECTGGKTCVAQKAPDAPHTIGVCK